VFKIRDGLLETGESDDNDVVRLSDDEVGRCSCPRSSRPLLECT
jgi:hypothetical protein